MYTIKSLLKTRQGEEIDIKQFFFFW